MRPWRGCCCKGALRMVQRIEGMIFLRVNYLLPFSYLHRVGKYHVVAILDSVPFVGLFHGLGVTPVIAGPGH